MCTKYKVCGQRHQRKVYKNRDSRGRFITYRPLTKLFLGLVLVGAVSMLGINTIWSWAKSLEKTIVVGNSYAEETITITLEDKIYAVAKKYGINGYQMYRTVECETT